MLCLASSSKATIQISRFSTIMPGTTISSRSSRSCSPSVTVLKKRRRGNLDEDVALKAPRRLPVTRSATRLGQGLTKEFPTTQAPPSQPAAKVVIAKPPPKPPAIKKIQSNYFLREAARLVGCDLPTTGNMFASIHMLLTDSNFKVNATRCFNSYHE